MTTQIKKIYRVTAVLKTGGTKSYAVGALDARTAVKTVLECDAQESIARVTKAMPTHDYD